MHRIKKCIPVIVASLLIIISVTVLVAPPAFVAADAKGQVCNAVGGCDGGGAEIGRVIKEIINLLSAVGGIIAVFMIIIGGFKYMTSGGDSNGAANARNTIIYAAVGLIIVAFAQIIVRFVLQNL